MQGIGDGDEPSIQGEGGGENRKSPEDQTSARYEAELDTQTVQNRRPIGSATTYLRGKPR
jgi:hypothetical protein